MHRSKEHMMAQFEFQGAVELAKEWACNWLSIQRVAKQEGEKQWLTKHRQTQRLTSVRSPTTKIVIDKNIPILQEYGINHYIQPEQLYQDIAYYVSNKMVTSPDLEVHDNMTDKEKIVQHGFDLKQSFRHRK